QKHLDKAEDYLRSAQKGNLYLRNLALNDPKAASDKEDKIRAKGDLAEMKKYGLINPDLDPNSKLGKLAIKAGAKHLTENAIDGKAIQETVQEISAQHEKDVSSSPLEHSLTKQEEKHWEVSNSGPKENPEREGKPILVQLGHHRSEEALVQSQSLELKEPKQTFEETKNALKEGEGNLEWKNDPTKESTDSVAHFVVNIKDEEGKPTGDHIRITLEEGKTPQMTFKPDSTNSKNLEERRQTAFEQVWDDFAKVNEKAHREVEPSVMFGVDYTDKELLGHKDTGAMMNAIEANGFTSEELKTFIALDQTVRDFEEHGPKGMGKPQSIVDAEKILSEAGKPQFKGEEKKKQREQLTEKAGTKVKEIEG